MEQAPSAGETLSAADEQSDEWFARHFDHLSPEVAQTMPDTMARMRSIGPVTHSDAHDGFWVVSGYEEAVDAAQNWSALSSAHGLSATSSQTYVRNLPVEVDPPAQRVYKRMLSPHFTPAVVSRWEVPTRALVTGLIDAVIDDGHCDFMDAIARPLPSRAFFEYAIGAPAEDLDRVAYLAATSSISGHPEAAECGAALYQWIKEFIAARRTQPPRGDVVDAVAVAEVDGRPITEDEVIGSIQLIILGGLETTAGALGHVILRFCRQPEIADLLRGQPELISEGIQELMRLDPSFVSIGRMAVKDTELGGKTIKAGDRVLIHWASANRDSREFGRPDEFDLERQNRHLSFGVGPHRCLGSNLARMNMRIVLEEVLRRMDHIRLADGAETRFAPGLTRTPLSVPITFTSVK
jgi:cytochrome P450